MTVRTSAQQKETPTGKPATDAQLAEQQTQGQQTAPFNTSPAKGVAAPQPAVPGANIQHKGAAGPDPRYGATITGAGSERDQFKPGPSLPGPGVQGAPSMAVDTAPLPADVVAATASTPAKGPAPVATQPQPRAPAPSQPSMPPPTAQAVPQPVQPAAARAPVSPPGQPSAPPVAPAGETTPTGLAGQVPHAEDIINQSVDAAVNRPVLAQAMPSIANSSKDFNGPVVIDPQVLKDHPDYIGPLKVHETVEGALMAHGMPADLAHDIATRAERTQAEQMGINWDDYTKYFKDVSPQIEAQKIDPATWQNLDLHEDPYAAIGHHTNKDIFDEEQQALAEPPLSTPGAEPVPPSGTAPDYNEIPDFLRRQPPAAQAAIGKSTGSPVPASLGAAAAGPAQGTGGMKGGKIPPPNSINPNPHDPANPQADPAGQAYADSLYDQFNLMRSRLRNAYQSMRNQYMKAPKGSDEDWAAVGQAWTRHTEDQLPDNLKPLYDYYANTIAPKQLELAQDVYARNKKLGLFNMDDPNAESPTRFLPRQEINDEIIPRGEDVLTGQRMTGWDPAVAPRDFKLAVEGGPDGRFRPDGKSFLIKDNDDGISLTRWDGKTPEKYDYERPDADPDDEPRPLNVGDEVKINGKSYMIGHADAQHVEEQGLINPLTGKPIEYNKNALTASMVSTEGLLRSRDTMKLLDDIKTDPKFADRFVVGGSREAEAEAKEKFGGLYRTNLEQFQGSPGKPLYMSQATAQALNDFKAPGFKTPNWLTTWANRLIKTMYVPGFPIHDLNVATQWFVGKPWNHTQAWRGLLEDFPRAYKDVMSQGDIQQEIRDAGGSTQLFGVLDDAQREQIYRNAGQQMVQHSDMWEKIAGKIGKSVPQLAQDVYDWSRRNMWKINDMLYTQQYMTYRRMRLPPADAVAQTEKFIPNYRLNNKVLGSRNLAQLYNTPGLSLFGRYHAGLWNSWQGVINGAIKGDPDQKKAAVTAMIAMGVAGMFIKPYIMDPIARGVTGNQNAEFGPRGMLTIPSHLAQLAAGKEGYEATAPNLFTPSLPISAAMGAIRNQDWTGQPIIPRANLANPLKAGRAITQGVDYLGKTLLPPYSSLASNISEKGTNVGRIAGKELTGNLGIKNPSPAGINYMTKIEQNNARIQKAHKQGPLEKVYTKLTGQ
jgi:hypothetical protein